MFYVEYQRVSTGTIFSHKNMKTYLSRPKKGTFGGLPGISLSRGRDIAEHRKKHIFKHSFSPATPLSPLLVGCLDGCRVGCCVVVMLFLLSLFTLLPRCQHCHHHHRPHTVTPATAATAVGQRGGGRLLHKRRQQPPQSAQAVCWALESRASLDRPLPAGRAGG